MKKIYTYINIVCIALSFICTIGASAQTYTAPASFSFTNVGNNTSFSTKYILVNTSTNLISYLSETTNFSGIAAGTYSLYAVNYNPAGTVPTLTTGTNLSAIGGNCVGLSAALTITVSANTTANYTAPANFSFNHTGHNNVLTTVYVLVNASTGIIAYVSNTTSFNGIDTGTYTLYGINYNSTGTMPTIVVGTNIGSIGGACVALSSTLSVVVSCATNLALVSTADDFSSGTILRKSSATITATNSISGSASVTYQSAGSVIFSAGFKVEPSMGGYLITTIAGCN
jgi:hypothetical protein